MAILLESTVVHPDEGGIPEILANDNFWWDYDELIVNNVTQQDFGDSAYPIGFSPTGGDAIATIFRQGRTQGQAQTLGGFDQFLSNNFLFTNDPEQTIGFYIKIGGTGVHVDDSEPEFITIIGAAAQNISLGKGGPFSNYLWCDYQVERGVLNTTARAHLAGEIVEIYSGDPSLDSENEDGSSDDGGTGGASYDNTGHAKLVGVLNGFFYIDSTTKKPTFANSVAASQAFGTNPNTGSTNGFAFVNNDPFQEYLCNLFRNFFLLKKCS
mgnify:CR=1 FL=1